MSQLHIVLLEPEIPQNTGNIARSCAALGARLHLIEPLGFSLDSRYLKRAGLDYWHLVDLKVHPNWKEFSRSIETAPLSAGGTGVFYISTRGQRLYTEAEFPIESYFVFGRESAGLPAELLETNAACSLRIPMRGGPRSLNLSNAAAIIAYEYARRIGFPGMK